MYRKKKKKKKKEERNYLMFTIFKNIFNLNLKSSKFKFKFDLLV